VKLSVRVTTGIGSTRFNAYVMPVLMSVAAALSVWGKPALIGSQLARQKPHPESVPVNLLVRVEGTPLAKQADLDPFEFVRTIAVARILMPQSHVRLSAGREQMNDELQALCFLAGANSIFYGEKLLTTPNPEADRDRQLFERLGLRPV
jgi:biotin synthase